MSLDASLYQYLSGKTSLTALVGTRIYRDHLPQPYDWTLGPCISLWTVSENFDTDLSGSNGIARARVQIDVWGVTGKQVIDVTEAVRRVLQGYRGQLNDDVETISTQLAQVNSFLEVPQDGTDVWRHHKAADYMIRYHIPVPEF